MHVIAFRSIACPRTILEREEYFLSEHNDALLRERKYCVIWNRFPKDVVISYRGSIEKCRLTSCPFFIISFCFRIYYAVTLSCQDLLNGTIIHDIFKMVMVIYSYGFISRVSTFLAIYYIIKSTTHTFDYIFTLNNIYTCTYIRLYYFNYAYIRYCVYRIEIHCRFRACEILRNTIF